MRLDSAPGPAADLPAACFPVQHDGHLSLLLQGVSMLLVKVKGRKDHIGCLSVHFHPRGLAVGHLAVSHSCSLCMFVISICPVAGGVGPGPDMRCELINNRDSASGICCECSLNIARVEPINELANGRTRIVAAGCQYGGDRENESERCDEHLLHLH